MGIFRFWGFGLGMVDGMVLRKQKGALFFTPVLTDLLNLFRRDFGEFNGAREVSRGRPTIKDQEIVEDQSQN